MAVALAALSVGAGGQTASTTESGLVSILLVPRTQMPQGDVRLVLDNQAAIARSAEIYGYALDSSYDYKEIACPLAPNHILLAYESERPNGAASRFTAVVRRSSAGAGGVQIISISHFGSVPFLPAGSNPHTIEVFNRVVSAAPVGQAVAENPGSNPLLFNSLCYLAMIGEAPAALTAPSLNPATVHAPVPTLKFREKGSVTQVVSVRNSSETYQVWNFAFGQDGRLLSAERVDHPIETTPPILNAGATSSPALPMPPAEVGASPVVAPSVAPTAAATPSAPAMSGVTAAPAPVAEKPTAAANSAAATPSASETVAAPTASAPAVTASAAPGTKVATPAVAASSAGASPVAPNMAEPAHPVPAAPPATDQLQPMVPASAVVASAKPRVAAKVVPLPPERLITNLPLPPSRIIPNGSLPYPPQAPAK